MVLDECAFFRDETSAQPDIEIFRALTPALATVGGLMVSISSPYRKVGLLHQKHRDHFGKDSDDVLVVQGDSRTFNPLLDAGLIAAAERDDAQGAASEWGALFRSDLASLFDDAVIDASIDFDRPLELEPRHGVVYHCFVDASAGRHDSFTCAIGHAQDGVFIVDALRGRKPPFDPGEVAAEHAELAKSYGCTRIVGDAFAGEWVSGAFKDCGLAYETSALPKSALYIESLPWFNRGAVRLPDHAQLLRELRLLERRTHRSGRDSCDHPRNGSDDYSNVVVGCLHLAVMAERRGTIRVGGWDPATSVKVYWHPEQLPKQPGLRIVSYSEKEYRERFGRVNRW